MSPTIESSPRWYSRRAIAAAVLIGAALNACSGSDEEEPGGEGSTAETADTSESADTDDGVASGGDSTAGDSGGSDGSQSGGHSTTTSGSGGSEETGLGSGGEGSIATGGQSEQGAGGGSGASGGSSGEPGAAALGSSSGDGTGCDEGQIVDACGICDGDGSSCGCLDGELCWEIVFEHNEVRRLINLGQFSGQPAANPPIAMVGWDPLIAEKAQEWADQMQDWEDGHSSSQFRTYPSTHQNGYHGENMAVGGGEFAEPHEFVYKSWCESEAQGCTLQDCGGHYTQVVWRESVWIGCGRKEDLPFEVDGMTYTGTLTVCEYGPGGNDGSAPY